MTMRAPPPSAASAAIRAALDLDHLGDDGQTEARTREAAGGRGAVEAVEDVGQIARCNARSVVVDHHPALTCRHLDVRTGGAPLARVVQEVPNGAATADRDRH